MKTLTLTFILFFVSNSSAVAQGSTSCVDLSGKFIQILERVDYPDGTFENDTPMDKSPLEISEAADCSEVTFTSTNLSTGKPESTTDKFDDVPSNAFPFNNVTGNGKKGNLTFYSASSLTDTGFKIDSECSLNDGPIKPTGMSAAYSLDNSGNLVRTIRYPDGVKITYSFKRIT